MGMENHQDHDQVQGARLCVYQLPMVTTRDLKDHQLWLGWQDTPLGRKLSNSNVLLFCSLTLYFLLKIFFMMVAIGKTTLKRSSK